jgi:hypothetical protein
MTQSPYGSGPIGQRWADWTIVHTPIPKRLYHYTAGTALTSILDSSVLWATNASYLNDSKELLYCMELLDELWGLWLGDATDAEKEARVQLPAGNCARADRRIPQLLLADTADN